MRLLPRITAILLSGIMGSINVVGQDLVSYVNPLIGTHKMGHTFPGACAPFGMVQLSPDTDTIPHNINGRYQKDVYKYCAGYQYSDPTIVGFSHTHFSGTGHSDLGDFLVMPTSGPLKLNPGTSTNPQNGYRSTFSHETEIAKPGYYEVKLEEYDIKAQLTATERTGIHKYTFPSEIEKRIILDLSHGIYNYDGKVLWANLRVENDTLITGYRITNGWARVHYIYFAASFSKPIKNYGYIDHKKPAYSGFWRKFDMSRNFPEIGGKQIVSFFEFEQEATEIEVRLALSSVSTIGAMKNLMAETSGKSFEQIVNQTQQKWNKELSVIDIEGTDDQKVMFYTSLYHTMINPSIYMDVDGQYRGIDHNIHKADDFTNYSIFSVWDTYRALHPLFNLIQRQRSKEMVNSMLAHYRQSVHHSLPVWSHMGNENWCMIGYHSVSILADALTKGVGLDSASILQAMYASSNIPYYDGISEYKKLGYVPVDKHPYGNSITLEYAYDDWAIYHTAKLLNNDSLKQQYKSRAQNYQHLFNPKVKFVTGKLSNGKWVEKVNLLDTHGQGFIEGNSWNYSFYVPHDVLGLMNEMGGDLPFISRLDSLFTMHLPNEFYSATEDVTQEGIMGNYVHGNEPSHHIPYLYAWTSQPWKSQIRIREIMNHMYRNSIDGLCGNDDCGQMSAWYIFSAMGFYPVCPGTNQFVIGAPYLPYIKVHLGNGKYLSIKADKVSNQRPYIHSILLNGKPYKKAYISYDDIKDGATLVFNMSPSPNKKRVLKNSHKPYSLTSEK
ncbi:GH92 family glycosyl hydrolase [Thermophagus sp. OGC60D27]|uniref:GH92 family glycosyl hydrolase n=1 Tax=Thermophagus sp. OGC60D27 TaxID=3458415 RepID=UPI0040379111